MKYMANLKCNYTRASFENYANTLNLAIEDEEVFVFPTSSSFLKSEYKFIQGAQNFYPCADGSFTGEIGSSMLDEFGIKTVIIGHSERRMMGEDESFLKKKFDFAKNLGWNIIYCIGEDDIVYMNGSTKDFLSEQLENIDLAYEKLFIAYEPIWAIGTNKSADCKTICDILYFIALKSNSPILYGGSVSLNNINEIKQIENCSGVLVGTASWDVNNFIKIIKS